MNGQQAVEILKKDLVKREYSPRTIKIYTDWVFKLADFFEEKPLDLLGQKEIEEFLTHLHKRLNLAASSIHQAFHSFRYLYNKIWNKDLNFGSIEKPVKERSNPDVLTPDEVIQIIENTNNLKHRLLISIAYSAGLELHETKNLKLSDIDINRSVLKIRDNKGRLKREAVFSKFVEKIYIKHLKENTPKTFVFESQVSGSKYGDTMVRKILVNQVINTGIKKKVTFKTLKYSYIIHLNLLGRPLQHSLSELNMNSDHSLVFYNGLANRHTKDKPFSPLDRIILHNEIEQPINREYFEQTIIGIMDKNERDYLKEALTCMTAGSLRAGIIFAWNATILNLRNKCFKHGPISLNNSLRKHNPKAKEIKKIEDFAYIKDSLLLMAAQELGEIDKGEKDSLEDCLDTRNKCGHPGKYRPKSLKAASVIEELINIVFKK
jgi:site-specific recombinase XerD